MLRDTFLLALISSCASAIRLQMFDENSTYDCPHGELESVTEGPPGGFDDLACMGKAKPEEFYDPVCFEGQWIEYEWLDDPAYWACGKKPESKEYSICNF